MGQSAMTFDTMQLLFNVDCMIGFVDFSGAGLLGESGPFMTLETVLIGNLRQKNGGTQLSRQVCVNITAACQMSLNFPHKPRFGMAINAGCLISVVRISQ